MEYRRQLLRLERLAKEESLTKEDRRELLRLKRLGKEYRRGQSFSEMR
jgi:hypothetical protein